MKGLSTLVIFVLLSLYSLQGQDFPVYQDTHTPGVKPMKLSGPRMGFTFIPEINNYQRAEQWRDFMPDGLGISPLVFQMGWQFEWRYFETRDGGQGLFEFMPLLGGLEQVLVLPSVNLLMGYRTGRGLEFGAGPNISMLSPGVTLAVAYNIAKDYMNFPLNCAVTRGPEGWRFTQIHGWSKRDA